MSLLQIPAKYRSGLKEFVRLSESDFKLFIERLSSSEANSNTTTIIRNAAQAFQDVSSDKALLIGDALISLALAKASEDDEKFADDLIQTISADSVLAGSVDNQEALRSRLKSFLSAKPLSLVARASNLMYEYGNVYYKSRILTDVRSIFDPKGEEIEGALILHSLRVHYHKGEDHKDFYVEMDTDDLQQMIDTLERAKLKADKLKAKLAQSDIQYIEV